MQFYDNILEKNNELKNRHSGARCFILGSGPSINKQNLSLLKDEVCIALNSFYKYDKCREIGCEYWVIADPDIWNMKDSFLFPLFKSIEEQNINTKMFFPFRAMVDLGKIPRNLFLNLFFFKYGIERGIDKELDFRKSIPPYGQNVSIAALMLALYLGCNPIFFLGCEMSWWRWEREDYEGKELEMFYGGQNLVITSERHSYDGLQSTVWVQKYQYLQLMKYAQKRGIEIFNATEGGYLDIFPRVKYEDLFPCGNRSVTIGNMMSSIEDLPSVLGVSAIKLINEGEFVSALVLLNEAISQNTGKTSKVDGLDYLRAICLMGLGEQREAIQSARQDYLCNPSNGERSTALLTALGDDLAIAPNVCSINLNEDHHLISTPYRLLDEQSIRTADSLGVGYINDDLSSSSINQTNLHISTNLKRGSFYGRDVEGYFVTGGAEDGLEAIAGSGIQIGNRSVLAGFNFMSTQSGIKNGAHGLFEIQLIHNEYWKQQGKRPLRCRVDNGKFYILDLDSQIIAGSDKSYAFVQKRNTIYTLSLLLFQKGVFATLTGKDIPNGSIEISVEDCKRYIPGFPGFSLKANSGATSGKAIIKDWIVSPVGPYRPIIGAIGDSITAGLTDSPENESYVHIVTRSLGQKHTLNCGSGGAGTLLDVTRFPLEIAPFEPGIVWIEGGSNDIIGGASGIKLFENFQHQIRLIKWDGIPLLSTIPPSMNFDASKQEQRNIVNRMIRRSGHAFVDRDAALRNLHKPNELEKKFDQGDGLHVNALGHRKVAEKALNVVRSLLKSCQSKPS